MLCLKKPNGKIKGNTIEYDMKSYQVNNNIVNCTDIWRQLLETELPKIKCFQKNASLGHRKIYYFFGENTCENLVYSKNYLTKSENLVKDNMYIKLTLNQSNIRYK